MGKLRPREQNSCPRCNHDLVSIVSVLSTASWSFLKKLKPVARTRWGKWGKSWSSWWVPWALGLRGGPHAVSKGVPCLCRVSHGLIPSLASPSYRLKTPCITNGQARNRVWAEGLQEILGVRPRSVLLHCTSPTSHWP